MNPSSSNTYPQSMTDTVVRSEQVTLQRLEDRISWFDRHGARNRVAYKCLKTLSIVSAAAIPVLTTINIPHGAICAAVLGVSIAMLEGVQQLNQCHANWATYRATADALKREKYFYLAHAGPYLKLAEPHPLLAERVELLVSQVSAKSLLTQSPGGTADPDRSSA